MRGSILAEVETAVDSGARRAAAAREIGISARTIERWRTGGEDRREGPTSPSPNRLTAAERRRILDVAASPERRDLSPKQIVPRLADRGVYVGSESSFYRVLGDEGQAAHRVKSRPPNARRPLALVAAKPNTVWSWDITYSRPRTSDDNPYFESLFRALKYRPEYPSQPFASIDAARAWVARFVDGYNEIHLHSGIGHVTPASRHQGRDAAILTERRKVYAAARRRNPARWSGEVRDCEPVGAVALNPQRPDVVTTTTNEAAA